MPRLPSVLPGATCSRNRRNNPARRSRAAGTAYPRASIRTVAVGLIRPRGFSGSNQTLYFNSPARTKHRLIAPPGGIVIKSFTSPKSVLTPCAQLSSSRSRMVKNPILTGVDRTFVHRISSPGLANIRSGCTTSAMRISRTGGASDPTTPCPQPACIRNNPAQRARNIHIV